MKVGHSKKISTILIKQGIDAIMQKISNIIEIVYFIWEKLGEHFGGQFIEINRNIIETKIRIQIVTFKSIGEKTQHLKKTCFMFIDELLFLITFILIILLHKVVFHQKTITKLMIIHNGISRKHNGHVKKQTRTTITFIMTSII